MSIDMFEAPAIVEDPKAFSEFWAPLRKRTLRYQRIELDETMGTEGHVPVVGYVDRQRTRRRLSLEAHQGVTQMFEALHAEGKVVFKHLHFEDFAPQQQLAQVAPVDVSFRRAAQLMIDSVRCAWQRLDASSLDEARVHCH